MAGIAELFGSTNDHVTPFFKRICNTLYGTLLYGPAVYRATRRLGMYDAVPLQDFLIRKVSARLPGLEGKSDFTFNQFRLAGGRPLSVIASDGTDHRHGVSFDQLDGGALGRAEVTLYISLFLKATYDEMPAACPPRLGGRPRHPCTAGAG